MLLVLKIVAVFSSSGPESLVGIFAFRRAGFFEGMFVKVKCQRNS